MNRRQQRRLQIETLDNRDLLTSLVGDDLSDTVPALEIAADQWDFTHDTATGAQDEWHFGNDSTFILPDGTKIYVDCLKPHPGSGVFVIDGINLLSGVHHVGGKHDSTRDRANPLGVNHFDVRDHDGGEGNDDVDRELSVTVVNTDSQGSVPTISENNECTNGADPADVVNDRTNSTVVAMGHAEDAGPADSSIDSVVDDSASSKTH